MPISQPRPALARRLALALLALAVTAVPAAAQAHAVDEARRLAAARDFTSAAGLLRAHLATHPDDLEAAWLLGQTLYWGNDVQGARAAYEAALGRYPDNARLRLDFARVLVETGDARRARALLVPLLDAPDAGAQARTLLGTLAYWDGDLTSAARLFDAALALDPAQADARRQLQEIRLLASPWVRVAPTVWHDDQPLDWQGVDLEAGWFPAPLTPVRLRAQPRRYTAGGPSMWLAEAEVRHYVPGARLDLELAGGVLQRASDGNRSSEWTGRGVAGFRLGAQAKILGRVERVPYLYTVASLETPVLVDAAGVELHWSRPRGWLGQAALQRQRYPDDNVLRTAYAWLLAPVVHRSDGELQVGYAFSTEDTDASRFALESPGVSLEGRYRPYYTPERVLKHAAIGAAALRISPRATLRVGGSVAIRATEDAPAFVDTQAGPARVFERRRFTPWDGRISIDVAARDRATIAVSGEAGRSAYYQWTRVGLQVTWRFTAAARRVSEIR